MVLHQANTFNGGYRYFYSFSGKIVTDHDKWFAVTTNFTKEVEQHLTEINYLGI